MNRAIMNCPSCGFADIDFDGQKKFRCSECNWEYYHNTAAAVAAIIEHNGKVLAVERSRDPGNGMLDFPGGFIDPMETAEDALKRELREELQLEVSNLTYLCTSPNIYNYKNIEYSTCDIFYLAQIDTEIGSIDKTEIAAVHWLNSEDLDPDRFAFLSMKEAIKIYKKHIKILASSRDS